jgi:hypothetical protein
MQCRDSYAGGVSRNAVQRYCDGVEVGQRCGGGVGQRAAFDSQHHAARMALKQLDA